MADFIKGLKMSYNHENALKLFDEFCAKNADVLTADMRKALQFALDAHKGQVRKVNGSPYVSHLFDVAEILLNVQASENLVIAGILHDIIGILLRVMYDSMFWARNLKQGGRKRPLLIVMEEAHNYLGSDNNSRASKVVRRLVKEGRKYGISAMIVSQRPSEIDPTILSQCGTTIALRLTNSNDRGIIANTISDNLSNLVNMLPILKTGESIIVGEAVRMPMRAIITFPNKKNRPDSNDPIVASDEKGKGAWNNNLDITDDEFQNIIKAWRLQQINL